MMKDLGNIQDSLTGGVKKALRHHAIVVILLSLGVMIFTVYTINWIITRPSDEAYRTEQQATKAKTQFDQETIKKLERLKARQENASLNLPSGRINPFVE